MVDVVSNEGVLPAEKKARNFVPLHGKIVPQKDNDRAKGHDKRSRLFLEDPPSSPASTANVIEVQKLKAQHGDIDIEDATYVDPNQPPLEIPDLRFNEPGWKQWSESKTPQISKTEIARQPKIIPFEDKFTTAPSLDGDRNNE